jgi:hypothetical protein
MFECWLTINGKILSSSKEATHSHPKEIASFGFLTFHQNLSNPYLRQGQYKNECKGQRKKEE